MKTPRKINLQRIDSDSYYWHQGLGVCPRKCFRQLSQDMTISLNLNIDGLPLHASTNKNFWPVEFNMQEHPRIGALAIGIFFGNSKPSAVSTYLRPFVGEMKAIAQDGLVINGH